MQISNHEVNDGAAASIGTPLQHQGDFIVGIFSVVPSIFDLVSVVVLEALVVSIFVNGLVASVTISGPKLSSKLDFMLAFMHFFGSICSFCRNKSKACEGEWQRTR